MLLLLNYYYRESEDEHASKCIICIHSRHHEKQGRIHSYSGITLPRNSTILALALLCHMYFHFNLDQTVLWGNTSSTIKPPTTPQAVGYPFALAWGNTYPNLISSSYAISGVKIGKINKPHSFTATLNANPTGGTFTYIPESVSSIVYAAFTFILVSKCSSGTLYM